MKTAKTKKNKEEELKIPVGTEQETGLTRAETEKVRGPVNLPKVLKKASFKRGKDGE